MTILVIKNNQRQALFALPVSLAFAVFGIYILKKSDFAYLGWPIILLFGFIIPAFIFALSDDTDQVVINDNGIFDRSLGIGMIYWPDIVAVHTESKYNNNYLCLKLKNSEKYLSKLPHRRRLQLQKSHELGFTHFNIEVSKAEQDLYYLLDVVKKKIKA